LSYVRFLYIKFSPRSSISMFFLHTEQLPTKLHSHFVHFAQTLTTRPQERLIVHEAGLTSMEATRIIAQSQSLLC
jgi:hypothetical protein